MVALTVGATSIHSEHEADCPDLGPACSSPTPPTPYRHVLQLTSFDTAIDAQLGVKPWLSIAMLVPVRTVVERVHYTDLAGNSITPNPPDTHHRDETIVGFADPTIAAVLGHAFGSFGFSVRFGLMMPLGRTLDEDPFLAGREGRVHEHIQFGAGTVRYVVGSAMARDFGSFGLDAWMLATLSTQHDSAGYMPGQRIAGGARVSSTFGLRAFRFGVGAELSHESSESWTSTPTPDADGNLGRTDLVAVATARWSFADRWGLFAALRTPIFVHAVGAQVSYPLYAQLGIATAFDVH